jgi:hypothetical protein
MTDESCRFARRGCLGDYVARHQPQSVTEVRAKQALTGDCLGPGTNDVGELRYRKQSLADIRIADAVGQDIDSKRIDRTKESC